MEGELRSAVSRLVVGDAGLVSGEGFAGDSGECEASNGASDREFDLCYCLNQSQWLSGLQDSPNLEGFGMWRGGCRSATRVELLPVSCRMAKGHSGCGMNILM